VHVGVFLLTLLAVELVKLPPEWIAPLVPERLEHRLNPLATAYMGAQRCTSAEGERAVRKLISRFDPELARIVRIEVVRDWSFVMTALPGRRLLITSPFMTEIAADEFAALLAHQVAHLQTNDAVEAVLRENGALAAVGAMMTGWGKLDSPYLYFSAADELDADYRALSMLMRATISPLPASAMFARMEQARQRNEAFGKEQYYLHPGAFQDRAKSWAAVPDKAMRFRPALSHDDADALFNYCWRGRT
jgi:Zn-dependent protease with chaperone function